MFRSVRLRQTPSSAAVALVLGRAVRVRGAAAPSVVCAQGRIQADGPASPTDGVRHHDGARLHALEGLARDLLEGLLDADALLGRGLVEWYAIVGIAPLATLLGVDLPLALTIDLVTKDHEGECLGLLRCCVVNEALLPLGQVLKGPPVCDIVY